MPKVFFELLIEDVGGTDLWEMEKISIPPNPIPALKNMPLFWSRRMVYEATYPANYGYLLKGKRQRRQFDYHYPAVLWHGTMRDALTTKRPSGKFLHKTSGKHTGFWNIRTEDSKRWTGTSQVIHHRKSHPLCWCIIDAGRSLYEQGALDTSIGYINQIRRRANLNDYSGPITKEGVLKIWYTTTRHWILCGRRTFLRFTQMGIVRADIKTCDDTRYKNYQTGKSDNINKFNYFLIPAKELDTNPLCTPNWRMKINRY